MKSSKLNFAFCAALLLAATSGAACVSAQKSPEKTVQNQTNAAPKIATEKTTGAKTADAKTVSVKQIDLPDLQAILKENADAKRPLLVNFWATWCAPCREEFPELVEIDREFRSKGLEFVTVSLDDLADKDTEVPAFLNEMKATMPAYLLKTADEETAIHSIAPEWRGALPLTVLYDQNGKAVYTKMGVIKPDVLRAEIKKVLDSDMGSNTVIPKWLINSDDPLGFVFIGALGKKSLRAEKPSSPPVIANITITKNQ